ncbi:sm-like protein LSM36B [Prosopis cineraria]|uniref:sm-like protein LSM36B n=1 Tax=Prosopis cineraria TaxID=364024 RepID=UPI00240FD356|nr:sm-like protein LSM36B [Prosopis cineraria]
MSEARLLLAVNSPTSRLHSSLLDGYMNIAMEQTEEYVNGQLKNKYGDAFIRGNNVLYISTSKRTHTDGA